MLSSCISNMSNKFEVTSRKFEDKLNHLESNSKNLNAKFEALQRNTDRTMVGDSMMPTVDATVASTVDMNNT
jgi:outer membrane murein-binding lipoprotein Lpp